MRVYQWLKKISTHAVCNSNFVHPFSKWNPLLMQPLEELRAVLHVMPCYLAKFANILQELPLTLPLNFEEEH
jgi:hypothetical protein